MCELVTTQNGTHYLIDRKKGTWEKLSGSEKSGTLRTAGGQFISIELEIGQPMAIIGPPIVESHPDATGRLIYTSPVVDIEEVVED